MSNGYFITGTDTDVGKTLVATTLLYLARQRGLSTAALKPVAAGCDIVGAELRNDDAVALQQQCTLPFAYDAINPVALEASVAPHIAAAQQGIELRIDALLGASQVV
ncbi:MAG: ATP-dependent dethiobiotin synthetase BioD, partial [Pseudomonadales bacterium]